MLFCPNPECPHRLKTGNPAEFIDEVTLCSDCGTALSLKLPTVEKKEIVQSTDFNKRLVFTLVIILFYRIIAVVPLPGVNYEAFSNFLETKSDFVFGPFPLISVLGLGIMSYTAAYMLVEIFALFTPPLKAWRSNGYAGRKKLKITALIFTIFIAFMQGYYIAEGLESMGGYTIIVEPGVLFRITSALTFIAGTFVSIWLAELITQKGIGHGISILIITGLLARGIPYYFPKLKSFYSDSSPLHLVFMLLVAVIFFFAVFFFEKSSRNIKIRYNGGEVYSMPLKLTTAGTIPVMWVSGIILFPASIASFIAIPWVQSIANQLSPGSIVYNIVYAIMLFIFYYFFTSLFYNPQKISSFLSKRQASIELPSGYSAESYLDKIIGSMALLGFAYLYVFITMPNILIKFFGFPIFIGGIAFIQAIAIILDVMGDLKTRRKLGDLEKVAEFHDIPKAGLLKSILEDNGIPCYLRGYYHRALLYLFGPYIEVSALVPLNRAEEAQNLIRIYMNEDYH